MSADIPAHTANLMQVLLALLLVLVAIGTLAWLVKRLSLGAAGNASCMKVLAAVSVGTRERLMLVEIGGQQLLIGVTPSNINTLHVFDQSVIGCENSSAPSEFGEKLKSILVGLRKNE